MEDQESNVRHQSNKRMDVMDLIKLASGEESDRRLSSVDENNSVLDSGDATGSNSIIDCNNSDTVDVFQDAIGVTPSISSESSALLSCGSSKLHIQRYHGVSLMFSFLH
ncbi:hypothetical protein COOONC_22781 [Cooperia oncophora]